MTTQAKCRARLLFGTVLIASLFACGGTQNNTVEGASQSRFVRYEFSNDAGTRSYKIFIPSHYRTDSDWPLLIDLHGCGSDADEEARWSRFNELAELIGLIVVYPEQTAEANGSKCWNWFLPEHQGRGVGEPAIIAGITEYIRQIMPIDSRRVFVSGISAGGAMANIMAVNYPDIFASAMIYAGCEYKGTTCTAGVAALPADVSGELAYQAMGAAARVVPVFVIQGDRDVQVPYPNAELVVQQFLSSGDWADDGGNNKSIAREPARLESGSKPNGHSFDIQYYEDAAGCLLVEYWLIHGLGHAWSNSASNGSPRDILLTDALGPDVSSETLRFLLNHPFPEVGKACYQLTQF